MTEGDFISFCALFHSLKKESNREGKRTSAQIKFSPIVWMQRLRLDRIKQLAQRLEKLDQLALKLRSVQIQTLCFKSPSVMSEKYLLNIKF